MPKQKKGRLAVKRDVGTLRRRALLAIQVGDMRPLIRDHEPDYAFQKAKGELMNLIPVLQKEHALRFPKMDFDLTRVPTRDQTPATAIRAYAADKSTIRVIVHVGNLEDDTTELFLGEHGITHLIGISIGSDARAASASWGAQAHGGMVSIARISIGMLGRILHDIMLDMLMAHCFNRSWRPIRDSMTAPEFAMHKSLFIQRRGLSAEFPFGQIVDSMYVPISSIARGRCQGDAIEAGELLAVWEEFARYLQEIHGKALSSREVVDALIEHHAYGGQLSRAEIGKAVDRLAAGKYDLYLLVKKPRPKAMIDLVRDVFELSESPIRTKHWIIVPAGKTSRPARHLITCGYIMRYPFHVGG